MTLIDPVYSQLDGTRDLDYILRLYPRPTGEPAFDPDRIERDVAQLQTSPEVATGHPLLDRSIKVGLVSIDATFVGNHPKYGVGEYGKVEHEGFPPTIIAAVDALSAWGLNTRAAQLFRYWLTTFVRSDGTIDYYGPAISEYGQLLYTATVLMVRGGATGWWDAGCTALDRLAQHLLLLCDDAAQRGSTLISGSPEADTREDVACYFHNNAWVVRGLQDWAELCERTGYAGVTPPEVMRVAASRLAADTLAAIRDVWPSDPADWWLPPQVAPMARPEHMTDTLKASYTNHRYWPELLSSGLLPTDMANRLVAARLAGGGQFCGMTRFAGHLDDWPLTDYLYGLWALGRRDDFLLSLYGHVAYHQAEGHLTAYEQISLPPGQKKADYCLPCQLVAARAARLLMA